MSGKFQNKYRIDSNRLKNYDYSSKGTYFITIMTKNREHFFGKIVDGKMILNKLGKIVWDEWYVSSEIRPDMNLIMDEFIVMPNHIHGIIFIGNNIYNNNNEFRRDAMHGVSAVEIIQFKNKFGPQRKNLSSIIRGFKSTITIKSRTLSKNFAWQPNFYDHIIRNEKSLNNIRNYIISNPKMWNEGKNE